MWYIGQRVVAITNSDHWKKGDEFTVNGVSWHCAHTILQIHIDGMETICAKCEKLLNGEWYRSACFRPIISFGEEVTEKILQEIEIEYTQPKVKTST